MPTLRPLRLIIATVVVAAAVAHASEECVDYGFPYNSTIACQVRKTARESTCPFGNCNGTFPHFCEGAFGKKYCCKTCSEPDPEPAAAAVGCRVPQKDAPCIQWDCPHHSVQAVGSSCTVRAQLDARCRRSCGPAGIVSSADGSPWLDSVRTCLPSGSWSADRPVCAQHAHHWGHKKLELTGAAPEKDTEGVDSEEEEEASKAKCRAVFPQQPPDMKVHPFSEVASAYDWNNWGDPEDGPLNLHNGSHFFDKYSPVFGVNFLGFKSCKGRAKLAGFLHGVGLMAGLMDWDEDGKPNCKECQAEYATGRGTVVMQVLDCHRSHTFTYRHTDTHTHTLSLSLSLSLKVNSALGPRC